MSMSSGQYLEAAVRYVECDGVVDEGMPTEHPCLFSGATDIWIDPEVSAWGWTCETDFGGCGKTHMLTLDSLPGF